MAGIVVECAGVRYAISEERFDPLKHTRVRSLRPTETIQGYVVKAASSHIEKEMDDHGTEGLEPQHES